MIVAFVAIGILSGLGSAVTTDVTYTGDGSYDMDFNGYGTGYCGVHTYTGNGEDHLQTTWQNAEASGWQTMSTDSYSYSDPDSYSHWWGIFTGTLLAEGSGSNTDIDRGITVGGMGDGADASGSILTFTDDTNGNTLYTLATYRDDEAWTSHATIEQQVSMYQDESSYTSDDFFLWFPIRHDESEDSYSGISGETDISGFAYGADTLVTGLIRTESGDAYTYTLVEMTEGEFGISMDTYAETGDGSSSGWYNYGWFGSGSYSNTYEDVVADGHFDVDADGLGLFVFGAGEDNFGGNANLYDADGYLYAYINAYDGTFQAVTQIDESLWGTGYVYSVDLP